MNKKFLSFLLILIAFTAYFSSSQNEDYGWVPDPEASRQFIREMGSNAYLDTAAPHLFGDDKDGAVLLYPPVEEIKAGHFPLNQGQIGSCVSFGTGACIDILNAIQVKEGKADKWLPACEESIYGGARCQAWGRSYAGYGAGASGVGAAKWCTGWGIVYRDVYPQFDNLDLRTYSVPLCSEYGAYGSGGRKYRAQMDVVARKHPVKQVALVRTVAEARAAIKSGYPINVCSGQGFSKYRDQDGFAAPSGSWSHSMCICGWRGGERPGFLILNSWGRTWISGPLWPPEGSGSRTQPAGSFWADEKVVARMLAGGDSYAYSDAVGFPKRKLSNSLYW